MRKYTIWLCFLLSALLLCPLLSPLCLAADMGDLAKENGDMTRTDGAPADTAPLSDTASPAPSPMAEPGAAAADAAGSAPVGQIVAVILAALIVVAFIVFIFVLMPKHKP